MAEEIKKKRVFTEEHKKKLSESHEGYIVTEETKHKISKAHEGKYHTEETKQKMSESHEGHLVTEETKQKISESQKGNTNHKDKPQSEETKQKISESMKGKIVSEETKQKMSESKKEKSSGREGIPHTDETKEKMRISAIKRIELNGFIQPNIGRNEKQILDNLELKEGYKIERQFKVGGYFLDGYIPELNLAIEVDEKAHEKQKERDILREEFIKKELGCEFLRIRDY